jgi:hypothetical protein
MRVKIIDVTKTYAQAEIIWPKTIISV